MPGNFQKKNCKEEILKKNLVFIKFSDLNFKICKYFKLKNYKQYFTEDYT